MRNVDLNLVRLFVAIYDARSVSAAATRLNVSQPTVSYGLAKLRDILQDQLFVRQREGMLPTPRAHSVYDAFSVSLQTIEQAVDWAQEFDPGQTQRRFVVAMSDIGEMIFLPPVLEALKAQAPHAALEVQPLDQGDLMRRLATGSVAAAIGNLPQLDREQPSVVLFEERYVCLARRGNPLFAAGGSLAAFQAARHVHIASAATGHVAVEQHLRAAGIQRRFALEITHFTILSHVLATTDLVALLPSRVARLFERYEDLASCEIPVPVPSFQVRLHWHDNDRPNRANGWFRRLARAALGSQLGENTGSG